MLIGFMKAEQSREGEIEREERKEREEQFHAQNTGKICVLRSR